MHDPLYTIDPGECDPYEGVRKALYAYSSEFLPVEEEDATPDILPFLLHDASTRDGVRNASMRHDAMARRKYVKPFKWFKFNRARKATAK